MPIKVPNNLPAIETLTAENIYVMTDTRAMTQDIRPLQILILNLMPTKIDTETQLTRLLGNTPLQVELELLQTSTHKAKNTSEEHMIAFYKTFDQIKHKYYDGMVITGAPVELMEFEEVEYWDELCEIMEWSKRHVHSTFHICWGAQAGLYYHYGIKKHILPKKLSGVYKHTLEYKTGKLFRGYDDMFYVPHSRNTTVNIEDIEAIDDLKIISVSEEAGVYAVKSANERQIFITGHSEYDADTLLKEYVRDKKAGLNPDVPCNYFPNDDDTKEPVVTWRSCANLLYSNWLNYFVYQTTPYEIEKIEDESLKAIIHDNPNIKKKVAKFGGSSLASSEQFKKCISIIQQEKERQYIVVSAPGKRNENDQKVTDLLIKCAEGTPEQIEEILPVLQSRFKVMVRGLGVDLDIDAEFAEISKHMGNKEYYDYIISRGEYLNAKIMAKATGYKFVDAQGTIFFDEDGKLDEKKTEELLSAVLNETGTAVIPGFYGTMPDGRVKTFSRGGSDVTGAIVASAIHADIYENWTDVTGFLMADPRIVDNPITVPVITYKELRELSYMGASVLHEDTIFPVIKREIPINIRNTNAPHEDGTLIVHNADYFNNKLSITGISGKMNHSILVVEKTGINENAEEREELINLLTDKNIKVKNVLTGIDSMTVVLQSDEMDYLESHLIEEIGNKISLASASVTTDVAMIAIVGRDISTSPAIALKVLGALANRNINVKMIDHGSGKMNIMLAVDSADYIASIQAIYNEFAKV